MNTLDALIQKIKVDVKCYLQFNLWEQKRLCEHFFGEYFEIEIHDEEVWIFDKHNNDDDGIYFEKDIVKMLVDIFC